MASDRRRRRKFRRRRLIIALAAVVVVLLSWSLVGAATTPGNSGLNAKWADWMRAHHAGFLINKAETWYYDLSAPTKGGHLKALNALPKATASGHKGPAAAKLPPHLPLPPPVPLVVTPGVPGEGVWQPVGPTVDGLPTMEVAQFRADNIYTSQITSAVWIDPLLAHIQLVPGIVEPGGTWSQPPYISPAELPTAVAAFNSGFLFRDAHGGFYLNGRYGRPLVNGAASLVLYKNGTVNVGAWGTEVTMTPQVVAVRQNLVPMVDNGQITKDATYNDSTVWGATLGAATVVARSGVGVTATGALVYVAGPALSARTLAESLQRAGAVRGMTLDINPEWVTFNFYAHPNPANPSIISASKLFPQQQRPATRYLPPAQSARDFFLVSVP